MSRGLGDVYKRQCITHRHRQQCGDGQRGEAGAWWRQSKLGQGAGKVNGDICNRVKNKNKVKKEKDHSGYWIENRLWCEKGQGRNRERISK